MVSLFQPLLPAAQSATPSTGSSGTTSTSGAANTSSALASATGSGMNEQDFLNLLVDQLKNQDPMNPMDDQSFVSQMAQLSTLEATNNLSSQMQQLASGQQQTQAQDMVGHTIQYTDANGNPAAGKVTAVRLDTSPPSLVVGSLQVPLSQVQTVL